MYTTITTMMLRMFLSIIALYFLLYPHSTLHTHSILLCYINYLPGCLVGPPHHHRSAHYRLLPQPGRRSSHCAGTVLRAVSAHDAY